MFTDEFDFDVCVVLLYIISIIPASSPDFSCIQSKYSDISVYIPRRPGTAQRNPNDTIPENQ